MEIAKHENFIQEIYNFRIAPQSRTERNNVINKINHNDSLARKTSFLSFKFFLMAVKDHKVRVH